MTALSSRTLQQNVLIVVGPKASGDPKFVVTVTDPTNSATLLDPHTDLQNIDPTLVGSISDTTIKSVTDALAQQANVQAPDGKRFFFPFGVQSISVDVKVAAVEVNIQVAGTVAG